jgi:hypothetical protein
MLGSDQQYQFWVKGLNADVRTAAEALTGNEIGLSAQQV